MTNRELKTIIKLFESSSLSRMKLDRDGVSVELEKTVLSNQSTTVNSNINLSQDTLENTENSDEINQYTCVTAPLVGTYYDTPGPDQPAFVRVGQSVKKGDTLCIIEAMKVMNEIASPKDGIVKVIHVKSADMVMYDQCVMEID